MSKIEWTERTWNPIAGCTILSPGCTHCYAMRDAYRLASNPNPKVSAKYEGLTKLVKTKPVWTGKIRLWEPHLQIPVRTKAPIMWFVNSMSDLFHEDLSFDDINKVYAVMARTPHHTYQILTKRSKRQREYLNDKNVTGKIEMAAYELFGDYKFILDWPLPNVWNGVSVEDQKRTYRAVDLCLTETALRFLSCEPLLGALDLVHCDYPNSKPINVLCNWLTIPDAGMKQDYGVTPNNIGWVIAGGESGPGYRTLCPSAFFSLKEQCQRFDVPFFMKQMPGKHPIPEYLQSREMPL